MTRCGVQAYNIGAGSTDVPRSRQGTLKTNGQDGSYCPGACDCKQDFAEPEVSCEEAKSADEKPQRPGRETKSDNIQDIGNIVSLYVSSVSTC